MESPLVPSPRVPRARVGDQGPGGEAVPGQEPRLVVRTLPVLPPEHRDGPVLLPLQNHRGRGEVFTTPTVPDSPQQAHQEQHHTSLSDLYI